MNNCVLIMDHDDIDYAFCLSGAVLKGGTNGVQLLCEFYSKATDGSNRCKFCRNRRCRSKKAIDAVLIEAAVKSI